MPQTIITFEALREELEAAVRAITTIAEHIVNQRDATMAPSRECLIQMHNERMPQEHIAQPQEVLSPAGLGPYLFKLPPELRDQIFTQLLASGYPTFMRTSRAMKKEREMWIAKEGIYRMNLACFYGINCHGPSQEVLDKIQNVSIRVKGPRYWTNTTTAEHPELKALDSLACSAFLHKMCNVSLEFDEPLIHLGNVILSRLKRLDRFQKVVLRVWAKRTGEAQFDRVLGRHKDFEALGDSLKPFLERRIPGQMRLAGVWCSIPTTLEKRPQRRAVAATRTHSWSRCPQHQRLR